MSTDPTNLLRMLEPAVRPDGRSARVSGAAQQGAETAPFERQSFDQLLQQARGTDANVEAQATAKQADAAGPLAMLSGLTRVENASLRHQLEARLTAPPADHTHNNLSHDHPTEPPPGVGDAAHHLALHRPDRDADQLADA